VTKDLRWETDGRRSGREPASLTHLTTHPRAPPQARVASRERKLDGLTGSIVKAMRQKIFRGGTALKSPMQT
jgi:hypothetical protein